jgi:hypothetical protein
VRKEVQIQQLIVFLDQARDLAGQFTGGYSGEFFSAEEFHTALAESIDQFKNGDESQLDRLYVWFLPTSCWDDFIGMEGMSLANEISELLSEIRPLR